MRGILQAVGGLQGIICAVRYWSLKPSDNVYRPLQGILVT